MSGAVFVRHPTTVALVLAFLWPAAAMAQVTCGQGVVSSVVIENGSIFDPDEISQESSWGSRMANAMHIRTHEGFLRSELLFEEGDCYAPALLDESERILREYGFIAQAEVSGVRLQDDTWQVTVATRDEWTTKADARVDFSPGFRLTGASVTEENLLGRGVLVGIFMRELDEQRDMGGHLATSRLLGTRTDLRVRVGRTRIGSFVDQALVYPFVGEVGRLAARQAWVRREEFFSYALGVREVGDGQPTHALLPTFEERVELALAARLGTPGNLTTFGIGVTSSRLAFPGGIEFAQGGDFGERAPATPEVVAQLASHTAESSFTRLNLLVGQRNIRFTQRDGLDALTGVQDVPVGTDFGLTLGRTAGTLYSSGGDQDDLYGRFRVFLGQATGSLVLGSALTVEGRHVFAGSADGEAWKDVLGEAGAVLYWQPDVLPAHTLLIRAQALGGWRTVQPFQLTLGGKAGVRGYRNHDFPSSARLLLSVEDRAYVRWPFPELFDFGYALFADLGRGWPGEAPFGVDSGWRGTVGAGLRLGFPAGSAGVLRIDAAVPLGDGSELGDLVVRMSLGELLGLRGGFESRQLGRSRRNALGPDRFTGN